MIPLASLAAKSLGKRIGKVSNQQMSRAGVLTSYLVEMFKNHKIIKIFQKDNKIIIVIIIETKFHMRSLYNNFLKIILLIFQNYLQQIIQTNNKEMNIYKNV